ncbi:TonB-dependent receptor [Pseudoduganella sp. LjRoot289]|uniref:TonB-dependent receptor n=1 Tax=Pseudoduganella sp. LjRoot289 TaxID=3342314 RepID=UPI003ECE3C52
MSEYHFKEKRPGARTNSVMMLAIASLFAGNGAVAQEAAPTAKAEAAKESVVMVVGTRKSVASAIDRKIRNATVSDSLVAEDINQFPDKNVGEALSRITGVQLTRDFGEGTQVAIRGVEPDLNRVEINGMSVLSSNGTAGRGAELRELASELIASIDVYKGSTADMTEGGIGGTVSIKTRKPLDFKKTTIASTISAEQETTRGGVQPRGSLLLADKFLDGRLGVMANVVYDNVLTRNDYARNTSWRFLRDWDFSPDKTVVSRDPAVAAINTAAGCNAATLTAAQKTACAAQWSDYSPGVSRYGIWTRDHKRSSAELTAQYKVSDELTAFVSHQANFQDQRLNDRNYGTDLGAPSRLANGGTAPVYNASGVPTAPGSCGPVSATTTPEGVVVTNHYVTQYVVGNCNFLAGAGGQGAFSTSARDFKLKIDSKYSSAGFNYRGERLEAEGLVSKAESNYSSDSNSIVLSQNAPGLKVTLDKQGLPHFDFPAAVSPENDSSYVQAQLQYRPEETKNTEDQLKLDFKYKFDTPFLTKIWFGTQAQKASAKQYKGGGYLASNGPDLVSTADDINVVTANVNQTAVYDPNYKGTAQRAPDNQSFLNTSYATRYVNAATMAAMVAAIRGRSPGTFFEGYDKVSNMPSGWMSPSYSSAAQYFDTSHFNHDKLYNSPGSDGKMYPQLPSYAVDERVQSAYLRADWETELFGMGASGNIGARYTRTRDISTGSFKYQVRVPTAPGAATFADRVISNSTSTIDNSYHDVLPSANAMLWLLPDTFLVRVGWAKVMARPRIDLLVPNATCTLNSGNPQFGGDSQDDCTAGNPNLKPFRAANTDLSFEYYPGPDTQVSMGLFNKKISSYILEKTLVKNVDLFKNGTLFDVTQPINGRGATTKGVELTARTAFTFLPGWLAGFGGDTNYTRMSYKYAPGTERLNILDGTVLPYPGMSKNSYNVALWYDQGRINGRVAYTYRDRFYTGGNDVSGNPNFQEKSGFLDAKLQYRYNDHVTFSLEGKNLTDQAQITDAGDLFRVNELAFSGRRYFVSVSIKN